MNKGVSLTGSVLALMLCSWSTLAANDRLVAWWKFEEGKEKTIIDGISGVEDQIQGSFKFAQGRRERKI